MSKTGASLIVATSLLANPASLHAATVIYAFSSAATNTGSLPDYIAPAIAGGLIGTTANGGTRQGGTVFTLTAPPPGQTYWTEKVLYNFYGGSHAKDGQYPTGAIVQASSGVLYGNTSNGGTNGYGTVYSLTPVAGRAGLTEAILHSFTGPDGAYPQGLIADAAGDLFGVADGGGDTTLKSGLGCGTAFELTPPPAGQTAWGFAALHTFESGADGCQPLNTLAMDPQGNLYGVTSESSSTAQSDGNYGTVFELSPPPSGQTLWPLTTLYAFTDPLQGWNIQALTRDPATGILYGASAAGGPYAVCAAGCGLLFTLTPPPSGQTVWSEATLFLFRGQNPTNGFSPNSAPILLPDGSIAGLTQDGGYKCSASENVGRGIPYHLTPPAPGQTLWSERVPRQNTCALGEYTEWLSAGPHNTFYGAFGYGGPLGGGTVVQ